VGTPSASLAEVIPFLATLPSIIAYKPETPSLTFRRRPGFLTLYSDKVYITQVTDNEEGEALLANLTEAINTTWERRAELVAVTQAKAVLRPLDIYTLLPQTNCGECGEATCLAFAARLFMQEVDPQACIPLFSDPDFAERRPTLEALSRGS
jgi:ArsR family metal-binding transcriptional regulator